MSAKKKYDKQLTIVFIFMIILLVAVTSSYYIYKSSRHFNYAGLTFYKAKEGNLDLILTYFPLYNSSVDVFASLPYYLRNDPRKLAYIEIKDKLQVNNSVGVVIDDSLGNCSEGNLADLQLSVFLEEIKKKTFTGTFNRTLAQNISGLQYVNCSIADNYSILAFRAGNESMIFKENKCYILEVKDCEMMKVAERFIIGLDAHANNIVI